VAFSSLGLVLSVLEVEVGVEVLLVVFGSVGFAGSATFSVGAGVCCASAMAENVMPRRAAVPSNAARDRTFMRDSSVLVPLGWFRLGKDEADRSS
jgi:hypothetical protein